MRKRSRISTCDQSSRQEYPGNERLQLKKVISKTLQDVWLRSGSQIRIIYWQYIRGLDIHIGSHSIVRSRWLVTVDTTEGKILVGDFTTINASVLRGPLTIGNRVLINIGCDLSGHEEGQINIGDDVLLAPRVVVLGAMHKYRNRTIPIREQGTMAGPVTIENDVWIGTNAVILPGINIRAGAVVGANAVVTKDVEPYTIVGGVPAKVIGSRK